MNRAGKRTVIFDAKGRSVYFINSGGSGPDSDFKKTLFP